MVGGGGRLLAMRPVQPATIIPQQCRQAAIRPYNSWRQAQAGTPTTTPLTQTVGLRVGVHAKFEIVGVLALRHGGRGGALCRRVAGLRVMHFDVVDQLPILALRLGAPDVHAQPLQGLGLAAAHRLC